MLTVTFYGVRGSTPCSCDDTRQFGGNTSCVLVEVDGEPPILLDLGTGLRYYGRDWLERSAPGGGHFVGTALVSHLHWDHIQGTPFFRPLLLEGSALEIVAPPQQGATLAEAFAGFIQPPVFPVALADFAGEVTYAESENETFELGSATVRSFSVPHVGPTNGYRIDVGSGSIAYISDHQQPLDGSHEIAEHIVEACRGVDVLIHDAQFDATEFARNPHWGHCSLEFALALAQRAQAKRLVLFHHDPNHDDAWVRDAVRHVAGLAGDSVSVLAASEGLQLVSGG